MLNDCVLEILLLISGIESNPGPDQNQMTHNLSVAHININSITAPGKLDELNYFAMVNEIKILALTETKLDDSVDSTLFKIKGFHSPIIKHRNRHGGGVAIYVHSSLPFKRITELEIGDHEWVWAKITLKNFTLLICCAYISPSSSAEKQQSFIDNFAESVSQAQNHSPTAILALGDFNTGNIYLPQDTDNHNGISSFDHKIKEIADALDLQQLIKEPTRISDNLENLRDLIFTSNDSINVNSGTISSFAQLDHFPIYVTLQITPQFNIPGKIAKHVWDYSKTNVSLLTSILTNTDWTDILDNEINTATDLFISTLHNAARSSIPIKLIKVEQDQKVWINTELKRQIRKRDRLFKAAKQANTNDAWTRWRYQRNKVTTTNRSLKARYMKSQVEKLLSQSQDLHKYHQTLRNITGRSRDDIIPPIESPDGEIITDDLRKATLFNDHFATQSTLNVPDGKTPLLDPDVKPVPTLSDIKTTEQEVLHLLNTLNQNKSTGPDGIPVKFLKMTALLIAEPLSKLFNKSLASGIYPSAFKEANVKPIFKNKGSPSNYSSYRPISLLSTLSKVFEKIVYKRMYTHFTENALLTEKQSGYRRYHSTQHQLLYLTHNLYKSFDDGRDFTAIYLDISKYFDKIWHVGLIHKCRHEFGLTGTLLDWVTSYLHLRQQRVIIRDMSSPLRTLNAGCPQGSVLGPLLALIYLNDLSNHVKNDILFFADDTSLYSSHTTTDIHATRLALQHDLDAIHDYGREWAITFNASKTIQQTFSYKRNQQTPKLTFGDEPIPILDNHTHLGVTFSKDLRFHDHINRICQKVNRTLSPLYSIAQHLPRPILDQIYKLYVRPHFDYCDIVYDGHITIQDATRLETLQNRAARLVTGTLFRTPTENLRLELGWESLSTRRHMHRLETYHKINNDQQQTPQYVSSMLPNTRIKDTNVTLRNANTHTGLPHRTVQYQRSFFPATSKQWNQLPSTTRELGHKLFTKKIREMMGPPKPPYYNMIGTKEGNILHTRLRNEMTQLNSHLFKIQKTSSPKCDCGYKNETPAHFVLACPKYDEQRTDLFNISRILRHPFTNRTQSYQFQILTRGTNLSGVDGRAVAREFQKFLLSCGRFSGLT